MSACEEAPANPFAGDFRPLLGELRQLQARLCESLAQAADALRARGAVPAESLLDDLNRLQAGVQEIRARLVEQGCRDDAAGNSLAHLERAAEALAVRQQALQTLEGVLTLRCTGDPAFPPLARCQQRCRALRDELAASDPQASLTRARELLDADGPLGALLQLVLRTGELDDERWSRLHERVAVDLGRELATAVARGRIECPSANDQ